jgi:beta-xylosidase
VAYTNGRYYLFYYFRNDDSRPRGVGVAVADDPEGPFTNLTVDGPLVNGHDPAVLVDDDGQVYLYTGGAILFPREDMASLEVGDHGRPRQVGFWLRGRPLVGRWEATWVFKREGRYYFTVVDDDSREIRYYIGASPLGPFDYAGTLLSRPDPDTIHHSIVSFQGRWILFYHTWPLEGSGKRRVSAEFLTFREDGTIEPVTVTDSGIAGG